MKKSLLKIEFVRTMISGSIAFVVLAILFSSCQSSAKNDAQSEAQTATASTALEVDAVLANAAQLMDSEIEVEGVCTHICKHGGRKIFLMGSNNTRIIRIEAADNEKFDANCINNIVKVKGALVEERIDETYLQKWEASLAEQTAEKHGDDEGGCNTEKRARGESANTPQNRIAQFRKRIAEEKEKTGKEYLAFYHIKASGYTIQE